MSESIKLGGVGRNPALEKINKINEIANHIQAVSILEKRAFKERGKSAEKEMAQRKQIIDEFHISFRGQEQDGYHF